MIFAGCHEQRKLFGIQKQIHHPALQRNPVPKVFPGRQAGSIGAMRLGQWRSAYHTEAGLVCMCRK